MGKMSKIKLTKEGEKTFKEKGWTGWVYTDATLLSTCPRCGAQKGHYCTTPKGSQKWPPHKDRLLKYHNTIGLYR